MKIVKVIDVEQHNDDFPPANLMKFREWLNARIAEVPLEHLANAEIEIDGVENYGSAYANVAISYTRPLTPEEQEVKRQYDEQYRRHIEERERAALASLQAKYGKA